MWFPSTLSQLSSFRQVEEIKAFPGIHMGQERGSAFPTYSLKYLIKSESRERKTIEKRISVWSDPKLKAEVRKRTPGLSSSLSLYPEIDAGIIAMEGLCAYGKQLFGFLFWVDHVFLPSINCFRSNLQASHQPEKMEIVLWKHKTSLWRPIGGQDETSFLLFLLSLGKKLSISVCIRQVNLATEELWL